MECVWGKTNRCHSFVTSLALVVNPIHLMKIWCSFNPTENFCPWGKIHQEVTQRIRILLEVPQINPLLQVTVTVLPFCPTFLSLGLGVAGIEGHSRRGGRKASGAPAGKAFLQEEGCPRGQYQQEAGRTVLGQRALNTSSSEADLTGAEGWPSCHC